MRTSLRSAMLAVSLLRRPRRLANAAACAALLTLTCTGIAGTVVAVCPVMAGVGIRQSSAEQLTHRLIEAIGEIRDVTVLDRSAFARVCSEQDVLLSSQWPARRSPAMAALGAEELVVSSLLHDPPHFVLSVRRLEVANGRVLGSALHRAPRETELEACCKTLVPRLWEPKVAASQPARGREAVDPTIAQLWKAVDQPEARRLLASEVQRVESVYRQYVGACEDPGSPDSPGLEAVVIGYLTDCLELLQRAQNPPKDMVFVPEGHVEVNYPGDAPRRYRVDAFFIDRCPVTRGQYAAYARDRGQAGAWAFSGADQDRDLPVVGIDWNEARAFADWRGMSLPTYVQWLRAVSGDGRRAYPWGDVWRADACNFAANPHQPVLEPVGSHPGGASPFGLLDGAGCVFEWLATGHDSKYWAHAPAANPPGPSGTSQMLTVGGSYRSGPGACSCRRINPLAPLSKRDDVGFRCVLALR